MKTPKIFIALGVSFILTAFWLAFLQLIEIEQTPSYYIGWVGGALFSYIGYKFAKWCFDD